MLILSKDKKTTSAFLKLHLFVAGAFICLTVSPVQSAQSHLSEKLNSFAKEIDFLHDYLQMAGLATALYQKEDLLWFKGTGYADLEKKIPVTLGTPFHLASLTKTYAATLVMQQVEDGRLELDQPVSECGVTFGSETPITIRHLLSHTSRGEPGKSYRYDGSRFAKLDKIFQNCVGKSFDLLLRNRILAPLNLQQTGRMSDSFNPSLAKPYKLNNENRLIPGRYQSYFGSSAGIVVSIADYAKYLAELRDGKLIKLKTLDLLFTPTRSTNGKTLPYGLGWFIETIKGEKVLWHYGYWNSVSTLVVIVPRLEITFLAFANTDALSRGFNLKEGKLSNSPLAAPFIEHFL